MLKMSTGRYGKLGFNSFSTSNLFFLGIVTSSKTGASGYLTKEDAPDHLVSTIRRMFYGGNSFRVWDMISVKANLSNASYS